jgi:hypothetical protein
MVESAFKDIRYLEGDTLPGVGGILVIYTDNGPGGPCGQSSHILAPHTHVHWFRDREAYRAFLEQGGTIGREGSRPRTIMLAPGESNFGVEYFEHHS